MDADIGSHVTTCITCQAATNKNKTNHMPLCKLSSVHVKTLNGLQLKMTELHQDIKYIEGKNNVVADFLSRYHGMNIHVTDIKYNEGRVNAEKLMWTALKIRHDVKTPYHTACNSAVETFNKILKHYIATALVDAEASMLDWEAYLAQLLFAYNTAVSSSTKVTPFEATFG
jgi:hypothetical protein